MVQSPSDLLIILGINDTDDLIMYIQLLKSKIHNVRVTDANLNYVGSITMDAAGIYPGEHVYIVDNNNGERFETYVITGQRGSGVICLNGAAARKVQVDDIVIIMAYASVSPEEALTFQPKVIFPNSVTNRLV